MTSANTLEMMVHPVQALRSARSGSPTVCSARTTHRGHPMWRLVHQLQNQNAPPRAGGNNYGRGKPPQKAYTTKPAPPATRGRVNQIAAEETDDISEVILGTL